MNRNIKATFYYIIFFYYDLRTKIKLFLNLIVRGNSTFLGKSSKQLVLRHKQQSDQKTIILFYNSMWGQPLVTDHLDIPNNCEITTDKYRMEEASAVVFHLPSLGIMKNIPKQPGQIWVAWSMESEGLYPQLLHHNLRKFFDLTMGYRLDDDVVTLYYASELEQLAQPLSKPETKNNLVAFFSSSYYEISGRTRYVSKLMEYLKVDSYGKCLNNKAIKSDLGQSTKQQIISQYKFTIAIENALVKDYVTEKFFDPLFVGSVPIYLGAPNIDDFAPGNRCFINIRDFNSPEALAKYILELDKNDMAYEEYFLWRHKPRRQSFLNLIESQKIHPFVRLCKKVQELNKERE